MKFLKENKEIERSSEYDSYLIKHINAVKEAYDLCIDNNIFEFDQETYEIICNHDKSKYCEEEYQPYADRFYGEDKESKKDSIEFKYAWLHHQHNNPHHWQHWCLKEDDGKDLEALDMPLKYIQEMICDWLSFSIKNNDLKEIQSWYSREKENQILSKTTREIVEDYLDKLDKLLKD